MFFAPLVQHLIKTSKIDLSDSDKEFIQSYIQYGYITLIWLTTAIAGTIRYFFNDSTFIYRLHTIIGIITFILLVIGVVCIFNNTQIINASTKASRTIKENIKEEKSNIIMTYLPLYNIYTRYKTHKFNQPIRRQKESLILWSLFIIACYIETNGILAIIIIIFIILRVASLLGWVDIIDTKLQTKLTKLFSVNPEEMRSYIIWSMHYSINNILYPHKNIYRQQYIDNYKLTYRQLLPKDSNIIIQEYLIGLLISILLIYQRDNYDNRTLYIGGIIIVGRYIITAAYWKHLPYIPIIHEIHISILYIISKIHILLNFKKHG